jgi:RNA polymerase sigma factor (sigma-70 family)
VTLKFRGEACGLMEWNDIYGRLLADRNDPEAWDALWSRVLGWARRSLWQRGWYAVEDAVEETCTAIVLGIEKAQGPATFSGFAYGHFLNARRRALRGGPTEPLPEQIPAIAASSPDETDGMLAEDEGLLCHCLDMLPERERRAVQLRYFEEAPALRIAEALDTTEGNARQIVFRAIAHLRECMNQARTLVGR